MTSPDELLDGLAIHYAYPDVSPSTFRKWVQRGHLQTRGCDSKRRSLYRWGDVEVILKRTRWRITHS